MATDKAGERHPGSVAFDKWAEGRHLGSIENAQYGNVWMQAWQAAEASTAEQSPDTTVIDGNAAYLVGSEGDNARKLFQAQRDYRASTLAGNVGESLPELIDRITPENQHIPERCEKCGETMPHLYDENCCDYRLTLEQSEALQAKVSTLEQALRTSRELVKEIIAIGKPELVDCDDIGAKDAGWKVKKASFSQWISICAKAAKLSGESRQ